MKLVKLYFSLGSTFAPAVLASDYVYVDFANVEHGVATSSSITIESINGILNNEGALNKSKSNVDDHINRSMRALTPQEIELIYGTNSGTWVTGGGCDAGGCHTTGWIPPPSPPPPPSTPPPSGDGGGSTGGGGGSGGSNDPNAPPDQEYQNMSIKCAQFWGHIAPNPAFKTNFTGMVGWTAVDANGTALKHIVTTSTADPSEPLPPGGTFWRMADASTFYDDNPPHTDIYGTAYYAFANVVKVLTHEFYHQNHDVHGESDAQRAQNEAEATKAGNAAYDAFNNHPIPRPDCTQ